MVNPDRLISLAKQVVGIARDLGIETALIGAVALAARNYERATRDIDLATSIVDPDAKLAELERALRAIGLFTALRLPDGDDDLGGVLDVGESTDEDGDLVKELQIVNFYNPHRPRINPGTKAVARAEVIDASSGLRCARLDDLVALKLDAGSRKDLADIVEVLARNPDADFELIRATCKQFDKDGVLETLIAEALAERR